MQASGISIEVWWSAETDTVSWRACFNVVLVYNIHWTNKQNNWSRGHPCNIEIQHNESSIDERNFEESDSRCYINTVDVGNLGKQRMPETLFLFQQINEPWFFFLEFHFEKSAAVRVIGLMLQHILVCSWLLLFLLPTLPNLPLDWNLPADCSIVSGANEKSAAVAYTLLHSAHPLRPVDRFWFASPHVSYGCWGQQS